MSEASTSAAPGMPVDRLSRDRLVDAIRRYLGERISAFEFDDEIFGIGDNSADPTVEHVILALWPLYDDCTDHKVVLSKEGWDYCQRLILLLESDAHVQTETRRQWSITQVIAGIAFLIFAVCAAQVGIGAHLFVVAVPFGLVSIGLARLRGQLRQQSSPSDAMALMPFSRVTEIIAIRRSLPDFRKTRYSVDLAHRRIRSPLSNAAVQLQMHAAWLMFAPVVLLIQMMPEKEVQTRIAIP